MDTLAPFSNANATFQLQSDPLQWRIIFFIAAGVYFFGNLQFIIFGKANIQPWNDPDAHRKRSKFIAESNEF